jgi:hypothetical protein
MLDGGTPATFLSLASFAQGQLALIMTRNEPIGTCTLEGLQVAQ